MVPALVLVIATFMILDQLRIAPHIVSIAFAATMFAVALGLALAFGLGGREVARQMLEEAYARGRSEGDHARTEPATGSHAYPDEPYDEHFSPERREMQVGTSMRRTEPSGAEPTTTPIARERHPADPNRT